jgi:dynein assembly factor 3
MYLSLHVHVCIILHSYYGTRFDVKTNLIDWDYSMRQIKDNASIIHPVHYRKWRSKGIAFELRDCDYNTTNTTLLTTRDAQQKKKGRINLRGYWGDIMLTPYLAFGIQANQKSLFEVANKVHKKNSHHVAEYNISSWTHQIQERSRYVYVDDTTHGHKNDTKQEVRVYVCVCVCMYMHITL